MKNNKETGVFKLDNGTWCYRFTIMIDGAQVRQRKTVDSNGNKLYTKKEAIAARKKAIEEVRLNRERKASIKRKTVSEVYDEYRKNGRAGRAYKTILKQESLWKNHIEERFGKRFIDDISSGEIVDYLTALYHENGYSFRYVESFLKMFYLIFGQAYSRNFLDVDSYNKLCVNKDTKIHMPKMKTEDDTDIVAFSKDEIEVLDQFFKGTNAETAYLLGRLCGLRINECFGLKWDHVDLRAGTIRIDRQQQYQDGIIKLVPVKTRNGNRTIFLSDKIKEHLNQKYEQRERDAIELAEVRDQKQRFITDIDGNKVSSTELVNCLPDGTIQTVNSMKYPTRAIKAIGIDFKYHYLRHTYGTMMAEMNTPQHLLCNQMGHGNINVTQRYYLAVTKLGVDAIQTNINKL